MKILEIGTVNDYATLSAVHFLYIIGDLVDYIGQEDSSLNDPE